MAAPSGHGERPSVVPLLELISQPLALLDLGMGLLEDLAGRGVPVLFVQRFAEPIVDVVLSFLDALGGRFVLVLECGADPGPQVVRLARRAAAVLALAAEADEFFN